MKCPICNNKLVKILYGLPSSEAFEKVKRKEIFLSGCEIIIGLNQPKYHCYTCNKNFYKDLICYEDTTDDSV